MNSFKAGIKKCHNLVECGGLKDDLEKKVDVERLGNVKCKGTE